MHKCCWTKMLILLKLVTARRLSKYSFVKIDWHNPKPWHENLFGDDINILYEREGYTHSQKSEQAKQALLLWNSNFRHFLLSLCQSFITWNELSWSDYSLIIPGCILQYRNDILMGGEDRSVGKKGKRDLRSWGGFRGRANPGETLKKVVQEAKKQAPGGA